MAAKLPPASLAETRFEALVRQYGRLITAVVARVGGARVAGAHEDVAQEILLALWKGLEGEQTLEEPLLGRRLRIDFFDEEP